MNELRSYACPNCGLVARYVDSQRQTFYKGAPPNCPTCHRVMDQYEESAPVVTHGRERKTA